MEFEWDNDKNRSNLEKHGLSFDDAWRVFEAPMLTRLDVREEYGEDRWITIGLLDTRVVVLVYTERGENVIRFISLRRATTKERKLYEREITKRLGKS